MRGDSEFHIAIIGIGPRGTYALERLVEVLRAEPVDVPVVIHLIEEREFGPGVVYRTDQPEYLIMNTVACQITAHADASVIDSGPVGDGPTLYEWLRQRNESVGPNNYVPRATHGRYLAAVVEGCRRNAPDNVSVIEHRAQAKDLHSVPGGKDIALSTGTAVFAHRVLLTTGNVGDQQPLPTPIRNLLPGQHVETYIYNPYPVERLADLVQGGNVGVVGLGLTAIDVIMSLTVGMGGSFRRESSGELEYRASGSEPTLHAWSRTGKPLATRGVNQKGDVGQYQPQMLTEEAVDRLIRVNGKIDFESDIEPLLVADMAIAYYEVAAGPETAARVAAALADGIALPEVVASVATVEPFSWEGLVNPNLLSRENYTSPAEFESCWTSWLSKDIEEARLGNATNPWKAACDALRDLRDSLRHAIEFNGLTAASQRYVARNFTPINNRLAVGPPVQRAEEILALVRAGVLRIDWGPEADATYDWDTGKIQLESRHLEQPKAETLDLVIEGRVLPEESELMRRLVLRRIARLAHNSDTTGTFPLRTIEVTREGYVVNGYGSPDKTLSASGQVAEGTVWYPQVAARYGVNSRSFRDAGLFAYEMRNAIKEKETEGVR